MGRRFDSSVGAVLVGALVAVGLAGAPATRDRDRVFAEPRDGAPRMVRTVFAEGMQELADRYPGLVEYSTLDRLLGSDDAFTSKGTDFQVATITDRSVPDRDKGYLVLSVAHGGEWCGLEAIPRIFEDLALAHTEAPDATIDAGTGPDGDRLTMSVAELLARVKVIWVEISPDGWMRSQQNVDGFNTNRLASTIGWSLPEDPVINGYGYATLEQPAGGAVTTYLERVRREELGGRPFAAAMDFHGPVPQGVMIIDSTPGSVDAPGRKLEVSRRISERTYEVLYGEAALVGRPVEEEVLPTVDDARRVPERIFGEIAGDYEVDKISYFPAGWNSYATGWEALDYDVPNSWGRYFGSPHSLGADSFTHEIPCNRTPVSGEEMQLYVDNVRAITEVLLHHAAVRFDLERRPIEIGGALGWVDAPTRVTDADGNPVPPPDEYPNTAFHPAIEQVPYDVSQTDWFADLADVAVQPVVRLDSGVDDFRGLDTVVVADHLEVDAAALRAFAEAGGNVVLTDRALALAPRLVDLPGEGVVQEHRGYVGYVDMDHRHPWAEGIYEAARQTFDPIPLGYPLLLERDQYWVRCLVCPDGRGPVTVTENSAPIWTIDRLAWMAAGGEVVGTSDPAPRGPKDTHDGTDHDKVSAGFVEVGQGRVVVLGAVLPTPSEDFDHWFGLAPYALTPLGQHLLLRAITWERPG